MSRPYYLMPSNERAYAGDFVRGLRPYAVHADGREEFAVGVIESLTIDNVEVAFIGQRGVSRVTGDDVYLMTYPLALVVEEMRKLYRIQ